MTYTILPATNGVTTYDAARDQYLQNGIKTAQDTADASLTDVLQFDPRWLDLGQSTLGRPYVNTTSQLSNTLVRMSYFRSLKTETVTQLRTNSSTTVGASATVSKMGLYVENPDESLTLLAATANDTSLWTVASTPYTRTLLSSVDLVKDTRYAVACICVTSGTAPLITGCNGQSTAEAFIKPKQSAQILSQFDLANTYSVGQLAASAIQFYAAVLP